MIVHKQIILFAISEQRTVNLFHQLGLIKITGTSFIDNPITHKEAAIIREYTTIKSIDRILRNLVRYFHHRNKLAVQAADKLIQYGLIGRVKTQ